MPSTDGRRRIELPVDIYAAVTQVAAAKDLPPAALASIWLLERLRQERPHLYTDPNTYHYRVMHARRRDARTYRWGPREEAVP